MGICLMVGSVSADREHRTKMPEVRSLTNWGEGKRARWKEIKALCRTKIGRAMRWENFR